MLTALLRLRQACSDPAALPNVQYKKVPPKLEALLESTQEIVESGESALVFTQFLQTLEHAAKILSNAQIPVYVLHGGIPSKQRQKILEQFNNDPKGCVLLMTLKTGGVGLNLTKASYVFHLEPWWNPAVENQATDRAHRLGQAKAVQVFAVSFKFTVL
jgi:SNF2 family DNA or RNA helicase